MLMILQIVMTWNLNAEFKHEWSTYVTFDSQNMEINSNQLTVGEMMLNKEYGFIIKQQKGG